MCQDTEIPAQKLCSDCGKQKPVEPWMDGRYRCDQCGTKYTKDHLAGRVKEKKRRAPRPRG